MGRHVDLASTRKEATRRQRIEAEQKRRDELRDGYAKLKDVLPVSNQKSSKVNLLERATSRIVQLETENQKLEKRMEALHDDIARLQSLNEKISLASGGVGMAMSGGSTGGSVGSGTPSPGRRPLSPPPEKQASSNASTPSA